MDNLLKAFIFSGILFLALCASPSQAQTCNSQSFSRNQVYSTCVDLPALSSFLHWNFNQGNNTADIAFRKTGTTTSSWVCWALNPAGGRMMGSQALIAFQQPNGSMTAYTTSVDSMTPALTPGSLSFQVSNLRAEHTSGETTIFATLHLNSNLLSTNQVWQEGPLARGAPSIHPTTGANVQSVGTIDFQTGATTAAGGSNSRVKKVHGVLNAVSWGILLPLGAIIARYMKACQLSAYIVGVAGWGTGLKLGSDSVGVEYNKHRNIGITLFCFGTLQV
ncbi:Cytochrome b561 and DOMON domain-containing protein At5g35735 [Linum perenne]